MHIRRSFRAAVLMKGRHSPAKQSQDAPCKALCLQAGCCAAMGLSTVLSKQGEAATHLTVGVQPAVHLPAEGRKGRIKIVLDCY